jgi:hypothetical protein
MKGSEVVAEILKAESTRQLIGFPHSELFDAAAVLGIPPLITRTERVAVNIAEGYARMTDGRTAPARRMPLAPLPRLIATARLSCSCRRRIRAVPQPWRRISTPAATSAT